MKRPATFLLTLSEIIDPEAWGKYSTQSIFTIIEMHERRQKANEKAQRIMIYLDSISESN